MLKVILGLDIPEINYFQKDSVFEKSCHLKSFFGNSVRDLVLLLQYIYFC